MPEPSSPARDDLRRFRVHTCLGSGGFGEVYRATMVSPGGVRHEVAIKVLRDRLDPSSQAVQRLRDEGRLLGLLRHPAILRVHDLVLLSGRIALVTEYVEGGDLDQCYRAGDLQLRPLIEVVGQVAAALDVAWNTPAPDRDGALNLIHRDVKPANIRVGKHGEVKLLDFGIAKAAGVRREAKTQSRALIGSYLYMSPERLSRKEGFVPAGDVYALGAVLFEGLARQRLFHTVDLKEQFELSRNAEAHDRFVKNAVRGLRQIEPEVIEILVDMLRHDEDARPLAKALSDRCEAVADALPGQNLRQWARSRSWPKISKDPGELGGQTLTETSIVTDTVLIDQIERLARSDGTMASFLDETQAGEPPDPRESTAVRTSSTIIAPEEDEAETERTSTTKRGDADAETVITPSPVMRRPEPEPVSPAPTPSGPRTAWGLVVVAVGLIATLVGGAVILVLAAAMWVFLSTPEPQPVAVAVEGTAAEEVPVEGDEAIVEPPEDEAPQPVPAQVAPAPPPSAPVPIQVTAPPAAPAPVPAPAGSAGPSEGDESDAEEVAEGPEQVVLPAGGNVRVDGRIEVEFRARGETHRAGRVPIGAWDIWADFGQGMVQTGSAPLIVADGENYTVKCSALRLQCSASRD